MRQKGVCTCFRLGEGGGRSPPQVRWRGNVGRRSSRLYRRSNCCHPEPNVRGERRLPIWNVACSQYSRPWMGVVGRAFGSRPYGPVSTIQLAVGQVTGDASFCTLLGALCYLIPPGHGVLVHSIWNYGWRTGVPTCESVSPGSCSTRGTVCSCGSGVVEKGSAAGSLWSPGGGGVRPLVCQQASDPAGTGSVPLRRPTSSASESPWTPPPQSADWGRPGRGVPCLHSRNMSGAAPHRTPKHGAQQ